MAIAIAYSSSFACAVGTRETQVTFKYPEGSVVYSVPQARRGIIEAIAIKYVRIINWGGGFGYLVMYVDTFNALWNEYDLCTEAEARAIAIAYLEHQQELYLEALETCSL